MGLYRKKRRLVWSYRTMVNGRMWERSTGETDRRKAEAKIPELRRLAELHRKQPGGLLNLDEAIVREVSRVESDISRYQAERVSYSLMNFRVWAGDLPLDRITFELIEQYQRERLKKVAVTTVDKELIYLLRLLRKNKIIIEKPEKKPGKKTDQREFTSGELEAFFQHCPEEFMPLFLLMLVTGARTAELVPSGRCKHVALLKKEVNFEKSEVTIRSSKVLPGREGETRTVGIPEELSAMLKSCCSRTPGGHVFHGYKNVFRYFDEIIANAGIPKRDELGRKVTAHSFRHTFATIMAEAIGGNQFLLQRLLGHKDIKTSARYCHLKSKSAAEIIPIAQFLKLPSNGTGSNGTETTLHTPTGTDSSNHL